MVQYINKAAVVEEIEKLFAYFYSLHEQRIIEKILSIIDNLEVKEADLNKEIKDYFDNQPIITRSKGVDYQLIPSVEDIAKHFFELGLKAAQKGE